MAAAAVISHGAGRGSNTGRKYNLSIGLQALNLFYEHSVWNARVQLV